MTTKLSHFERLNVFVVMIAPTSFQPVSPEAALEYRPRLLGLAYRMLGDVDEAEDIVQEAFLKWQQADRDVIRSAEAWLVTIVSRLAVDRLRRLSTERAAYPGPWLPEPIAAGAPLAPNAMPAPDKHAEMVSDLSIALLLMLERPSPEERAAFLLREVFDTDYAEIARILDRRPDAVRQMVHRAKTRVHEERPHLDQASPDQEAILGQFLEALSADDAEGVLALLAPDVELASDGGGRATAARNWLHGLDAVSRFVLGIARKQQRHDVTRRLTYLNGSPAFLTFDGDQLTSTTVVAFEGGRIRTFHIMRNPDKLHHALELGAAIT